MTNIFIFGGRNFNNYVLLKQKCDEILKGIRDDVIIVSGHAIGADSLGERYAKERGYGIDLHPAKWDDLAVNPCKIKYNKYGKAYNCLAGMNRNKDMANIADIGIAFWDGKSSGTANSINLCKSKGIRLEIIKY